MITSLHNPKMKLIRALLGRPKERRVANAFVAEGVRLVEEAACSGWRFRYLLYSPELSTRGAALVADLNARGVDTEPVEARLLQSLSDTGSTQGIIAVLEQDTLPLPASADLLLIPDQVRDPGNLGTLLRSAAAAGAQAVLLPPETADAFAPKVVRAGMGAHFRLPILALDWEQIAAHTAGMQVLLADMAGTPCWQTDLRRPLALIVGGEAEGASPMARNLATAAISIPMPGGGESLNAGAAGTVLLFEAVRQRMDGTTGGGR